MLGRCGTDSSSGSELQSEFQSELQSESVLDRGEPVADRAHLHTRAVQPGWNVPRLRSCGAALSGRIPGGFAIGRLYRMNWPAFLERSGLATTHELSEEVGGLPVAPLDE